MFGLKTIRRKRLRAQRFPDSWIAILRKNIPYYHRLSVADQCELQQILQVFLGEKNFEGCGGLVLTDEIRVTIAAYACVLLLHREHDYYPRLQSVLVYPDSYVVDTVHPGPGNTWLEGQERVAGQSWRTGAVIIAWGYMQHRPTDPFSGRNVVLHEFAHQLDEEDGFANGAPALPRAAMYRAWARVLGNEYQQLRAAAAAGEPTLLDQYGAKNPAEFFAVVTEYFFEQPRQLKERHPELYKEMKEFYRQDPALLIPL